MNYNELKSLLTKNKIKVKEVAKLTGYAENSFKVAFEDGTFSFSKVPILCEILGISPDEFFGWPRAEAHGGNYASNVSGGNTQNSTDAITALAEQLREKDRQIAKLLKALEALGRKP